MSIGGEQSEFTRSKHLKTVLNGSLVPHTGHCAHTTHTPKKKNPASLH